MFEVAHDPKKTKSMVDSRSRINAPSYGDLTLGDAEFEKAKSLGVLGLIFGIANGGRIAML